MLYFYSAETTYVEVEFTFMVKVKAKVIWNNVKVVNRQRIASDCHTDRSYSTLFISLWRLRQSQRTASHWRQPGNYNRLKVKGHVLWETQRRAADRQLPYGITQCYLPPDSHFARVKCFRPPYLSNGPVVGMVVVVSLSVCPSVTDVLWPSFRSYRGKLLQKYYFSHACKSWACKILANWCKRNMFKLGLNGNGRNNVRFSTEN